MAEMAMSSTAGAAMRRSASSGTLMRSGEAALGSSNGFDSPQSDIPRHLSVCALSKKHRRKLSASTGNLHGYRAEDYRVLNWPLPKMFGEEKYAYSLIDIKDQRYLKDCASMSEKLIRLAYDQQIIDLQWRKTYKALLDAEHRKATLPEKQDKAKKDLQKEVDTCMKHLLELQNQRDSYEEEIKDVYSKCAAIKGQIKTEKDLENLRRFMEKKNGGGVNRGSPDFRPFNTRSAHPRNRSGFDPDATR